jgi:hypothetical protein
MYPKRRHRDLAGCIVRGIKLMERGSQKGKIYNIDENLAFVPWQVDG